MTLLVLPDRVRRAESRLPTDAAAFLAGMTPAETFRAQRVPQGLYEQRTTGTYMLRLRLPGGMITARQAAGLARLTGAQDCRRLHLTTRLAIQCHDLPLETAVAIHQGLADLGLSSRGTGGNTVRNVTADPLAGVAPDEAFDVRPWALATTRLLLEQEDADRLPRKFKVVFSGSPADRAGAGVADLGFIACLHEGQPGFQVLVGGGLGGRPIAALDLEPWVPADQAPRIALAIMGLFAVHGDRSNKAVARLRHVRHRLGDEAFRALCREAMARQAAPDVVAALDLPEVATSPGGPLPVHLVGCSGILAQRQVGRFAVRLAPPLGDFDPTALGAIAHAAVQWADPVLRAGVDQELWLTGVRGPDLPALLTALRGFHLGLPGDPRPRIPACAGADTCKLGLLRSRPCATAIADRLQAEGLRLEGVRISGCPNSCGRHLVAAIGLQGRVRKVGDRLLPCYEVLQHGHLGATSAIAQRVGTVPAKRIPDLLVAVARGGDLGAEVARHAVLPVVIPRDWFHDWGDTQAFSLAGLGEGECAAG